MFKKVITAVGILAITLPPASLAKDMAWQIDSAHSEARFIIRHMMISNVTGDFSKVAGTAHYDGINLQKASVEAEIPIASINTRETKRDDHLKSPEFFDAEKYPTINFKSKRLEPLPDGNFKMTGDLTIHGVTKEVVLTLAAPTKPIKDPYGRVRIGTSATTKLNRKDFGLSFNKTLDNGGALIGDDVAITLDIELIQG